MKVTVILLLLILSVLMLSPFSVHINYKYDKTPVLLKLNVCHITSTLLSDGTSLPTLNEYQDSLSEPLASDISKTFDQTFTGLLIPFRKDKPPRV